MLVSIKKVNCGCETLQTARKVGQLSRAQNAFMWMWGGGGGCQNFESMLLVTFSVYVLTLNSC